jgi:hypothetical protein
MTTRASRYYDGVVKPRELAHDAAIYRMATYERAQIEAQGGRVTRVVLDAELKASVCRMWDQLSHGTRDAQSKQHVAQAYALPVVHGRIQFPDVRLEIEREDGSSFHVDLELATHCGQPLYLLTDLGWYPVRYEANLAKGQALLYFGLPGEYDEFSIVAPAGRLRLAWPDELKRPTRSLFDRSGSLR